MGSGKRPNDLQNSQRHVNDAGLLPANCYAVKAFAILSGFQCSA